MSLSNPDNAPLFAERPEWADVQPLEQYEDANPIAPIFYTEECECLVGTTPRHRFIEQSPSDKDATNYFRAIVKAGEKSPRVMELTEGIIRQNPAHYSAW
jgi:protein farnesyltransferase/geranylgeranyltransferase type-1 subunit alpha